MANYIKKLQMLTHVLHACLLGTFIATLCRFMYAQPHILKLAAFQHCLCTANSNTMFIEKVFV